MSEKIKINKQTKSITIINNGIAFSQCGIAKEILDLVDNQQQEIERLINLNKQLVKECQRLDDEEITLNNIISEAIKYIEKEIKNMPLNGCKLRLNDLLNILNKGSDK